ncbi:MAG: hypothetical protein EOO20_28735, partial [Chryseobacterium sp.]
MQKQDLSDAHSSARVGKVLFTFCSLTTEILDNHILEDPSYQHEPYHFYYTLLHKLRNILDASSYLIANVDGKPHYTDSAFLLLRTCLMDITNLYFVMDKFEDKEGEKIRIDRIMSDHVRAIYNSAKDDQKEREAVRETYPQYFDGEKFKKEIIPVNIIIMR